MDEEPRELAIKAVPKFASFRPKKDAAKRLSPSHVETEPSLTDERARKRAKRTHHQETPHRHRERELEQAPRPREPSNQGLPEKSIVPGGSTQIFFSDRRGDEDNLRYESLHHYKVPSSRRHGFGNVIGLSRTERIDESKSTEKLLVTHSGRARYDAWKKESFSSIEPQRLLRIRPSLSSSIAREQQADFILLEGTGRDAGGVREDSVDDVDSSTSEITHYRSIEGKAKASAVPEDPHLEYVNSSTDQQGLDQKTSLTKHMEIGAGLSRATERNPQNGQAWLKLIAHQSRKPLEHPTGSRNSRAEKLSNGEIKLSIYEKALGSVQDKRYKELLLDGMMEEASRHWDKGRLSRKWRSILLENQDSLRLWTTYLNFLQTNFVSFRFDDIREAFVQCLKVCRRQIANNVNTIHYDTAIYIFLRMAVCMRQAGFGELATAAWQAILEFNFCRPSPADSESVENSLYKSFEDFWESEAPRIGELEARGWDDFKLHDSQPPGPQADISKPESGRGLNLETWPDLEDEQAIQGRMPARTMDDVGEDDPFRVILFSDVEPFLLDIPAHHHEALLDAFLLFCGLPPRQTCGSQGMSWWRDPYLRDEESLSRAKQRDREEVEGSSPALNQPTIVKSSLQNDTPFDFPTPCYLTSTDTLFTSAGTWFGAFEAWTSDFQNNRGPLEVHWVRRSLKTLVDRKADDEEFAESFLAFECKVSPETAKKTAKSLLKKRSSSLRLYNAYALIEFRKGSDAIAQSVLTTALSMNNRQEDAVLLWRTWIWELMQNEGTETALRRLLSFFDESAQNSNEAKSIDAAAIFKAQQALIESRDHALFRSDVKHAVLYIECLVLLSYLSSSDPLSAALSIFSSNLNSALPGSLPPTSPTREYLHQVLAKLLYFHATHAAPFQPSLIRSTLAKSIDAFPHNTLFLSLYAWNETRFRIDDRVRSTIYKILSPNRDEGGETRESILTHLFAVHVELRRAATFGSNIHSIRGTFERGMESEVGAKSTLLWRTYFLFEAGIGELRKARDVFYRAIRACPWAKVLYVLQFVHLQRIMGTSELKGVYEMMVERELRIHVPLEEIFEELEGRVGRNAGRVDRR